MRLASWLLRFVLLNHTAVRLRGALVEHDEPIDGYILRHCFHAQCFGERTGRHQQLDTYLPTYLMANEKDETYKALE